MKEDASRNGLIPIITRGGSSLRKVPELAYYREVDISRTHTLNSMSILDLRRIASSSQKHLESREQTLFAARVFYTLFSRIGQRDDLDQAIIYISSGLPADSNSDYIPLLRDLVAMLAVKFQHTNSLDDLQDAIYRAQEMVAITPQKHPDRPLRIRDWIHLMLAKFNCTLLQNDLDEARVSAREVGAAVEVDNVDERVVNMRVYVPTLDRERKHRPSPTVETSETATATNDSSLFNVEPEMISMLEDMADEELRSFIDLQELDSDYEIEIRIYTCFLVFRKTSSKEYLERAILQAEGWVAVTPDGHPQRGRRLELLNMISARKHQGNVIIEHQNQLNIPSSISQDRNLPRRILNQTGTESLNIMDNSATQIKDNAGEILDDIGSSNQNIDMDKSATTEGQMIRRIVDEIGIVNQNINMGLLIQSLRPEGAGILNTFLSANRLHQSSLYHGKRFEDSGSLTELETAISFSENTLAAAPLTYPDRDCFMNNLGYLLGRRYELLGSLEDFSRAIDLCGQAIARGVRHPDRGLWLRNYGYMLGTRFMQTGDLETLNTAIKFSEDAVAMTEPNDDRVHDFKSSLGTWLFRRFELLGMMEDLEHALQVCEQAAAAITPVDYWMAARLGNLANCLWMRYNRKGAMADLNGAIENVNKAIRLLSPGHPHRPGCLIQLGNMLNQRFKLMKSERDIDRAIEATEDAVSSVAPNHHNRAGWLTNLGWFYNDRFEIQGSLTDLNSAIEISYQAVAAMPLGHRDRARTVNMLGNRYMSRLAITKSVQDFDLAFHHYKQAWACPNTDPLRRIKIAQNAAHQFAARGAWAESSALFEDAVKLFPRVSPRSLEHKDKQDILADLAGLSSLAAAVALNARKPVEHVLQLLELGRGVIAGLLMDMRSDISDLKERYPVLAEEFVALRDQLDGSTPADKVGATSFMPAPGTGGNISNRFSSSPWESHASKRLKADEEFTQLLAQIRSKRGFENFLLPPSTVEMQSAADLGPIIVVNLTPYRCDAFIVQRDRITVVELHGLVDTDAEAQSTRLRSLGVRASAEIATVLEWLWDAVARPSLDALGFERPVVEGVDGKVDWPHVWWVPTGLLTQFPLHAAGRHQHRADRPSSIDSVLDRVVSSYASSIKGLIHGRRLHVRTSATTTSNQALLIAMDETHGLPLNSPLPYARAEVEMLTKLCPSLHLEPITPPARKSDILKYLETCRIFHFAGHGQSDSLDPSRSSLLLDDWQTSPLTVGDLRDRRLQVQDRQSPPFLGYTSACLTAASEAVGLADETIHLVSALQLAGFRHVVGTLWEVSDRHCVDVARIMYEMIRDEGMTDRAVCRGLHFALRALRDGRAGEEVENDVEGWDGSDAGALLHHLHADSEEPSVGVALDLEEGVAETSQLAISVTVSGVERDAKLNMNFGTGSNIKGSSDFYWVPYVHYGV